MIYNWELLPMLLSPKQAGQILGISQALVYAIMKESEDFPKVKVGKVFKIDRDGLKRKIEEASIV